MPFSEVAGDQTRVNISGKLSDGDIDRLASNPKIQVLQFPEPLDPGIWPRLHHRLFSRRPEITLRAYAHYGKTCDLGFLRELPSLQNFCADRLRSASSIESISTLKALRSLSVEIYTIPDFSFLRVIPASLERLSLGETQSRSLSLESLSRFTMLRRLHLARHQKHLDVISRLPMLEELHLARMSSPKLEFLSSLPRLWSLELQLGGSKDLSAIAEAKGLKHLRLTWIRGLADVAFIARMRSLRFLGLDKLRQVQSLPEFLELTDLKVLRLENLKGLTSISSIAGAPALEWISFVSAHNLQPADFEAVLRLPSLKGIHVGFGNFAKNEELAEMARSRGAKTVVEIPEDLYA